MTPPILNANAVDAALANTHIATNAVATPETFWCDLNLNGTRARLANPTTGTHQVGLGISNSTAGSNRTNFETSADTVLDNIPVTVAHIAKPAYLSRAEQNQGITNDHVTQSLIRLFEQDIVAIQAAQITAANFGAADVTCALADFDEVDLQTLIGACASKPRCLLIPNTARAGIVDTLKLGPNGWQYPGVDTIREINAAAGDAHTVLAGPEAFVFIVEKPENFNHYPPGELQIKEITLPVLNIPAWHVTWIDRKSRSSWQSIEAYFGIAPANVAALSYAVLPEE
jgi:hypothetical protein